MSFVMTKIKSSPELRTYKSPQELARLALSAVGIGGAALFLGGVGYNVHEGIKHNAQRERAYLAAHPGFDKNKPALVVGHHLDKDHEEWYRPIPSNWSLWSTRHVPKRYYVSLKQNPIGTVNGTKQSVEVIDVEKVDKQVYEEVSVGSTVTANDLHNH